ncbi:DUF721 domain-containing protein [Candidatus Dependentiae bacterium]|nr:MAG: DUF721 domain-containing protein [Candidatus Dependentiae bacterium]
MAITELKAIIDCLPFFKHNWKFTLLEQWPSIIGTLNNKVSVEKITDNSVVLGVADSCWIQELYLLSPLVQSLINKSLDKPRIQKIIFKQKNCSLKKNFETKNTFPKEKSSSSILPFSKKESAALINIQDDELRHFLTLFRNRCLSGAD